MNLKWNKKDIELQDHEGSWVLLELQNSKIGVGMRDLFTIISFFVWYLVL